MEFEWDDANAAATCVTTASASPRRPACGDPFAVEWIDDRHQYGEERVNLPGMCGGVLRALQGAPTPAK